MTIDEAISKYRKLAENDRCCNQEEAQQLAEWLEELKKYQNQHNAMCEQHKVKTIEDIYNKAIEDFAEKLSEVCHEKSFEVNLGVNGFSSNIIADILTLAGVTEIIWDVEEQLKEGSADNG